MYYSLIGILGIMVNLIINGDLLFKRKGWDSMKAARSYRFFLFVTTLYLISDVLWGIFDGRGLSTAAYVDTAFYFLLMGASVFLWTHFVVQYLGQKTVASRVLLFTSLALFLTGSVTIIVNFFQPILFNYDKNVYVPAVGRYIFLGAQLLLFIITSIYALLHTQSAVGSTRIRYMTVGFSGLVMAIANSAQIASPSYPLYAMGLITEIVLIRNFVISSEKKEYEEALKNAEALDERRKEELGSAKILAYSDPLTGAKNKHAYVENEVATDTLIREGKSDQFALIVFDVNDLKVINDTEGHEAGDHCLADSCALIKKHFPKSVVFRYGGDEFVAFLRGEAYETRYEALDAFNAEIDQNLVKGGPVLATGIADYRKGEDNTLRAVFMRADEAMYIRKRKLKTANNPKGGARSEIYEVFYRNKDCSLIEYLNNSSADEIIEIDLVHDTFKRFYHTEGKYAMPGIEMTYKDLLAFAAEHVVHPDDREVYERLMNPERFLDRLARGKIPNFDFAHFRYRLQDGEYRYVEQVVIAGEENEIAPGSFRIYVFDIHNLKVREQGKEFEVAEVISHDRDSMTGLLREEAFFHHAQEAVNSKPDVDWCVISFDIEHFKFFDEWFGRETGDLVLAKIGATLSEAEGGCGGVGGYFGSDDFVFLAPYSPEKINHLFEGVRALIVSFELSVGFMPAFGVAKIENGMHVVDAYDRANIALSRAKKDIRNRIAVFDSSLRSDQEEDYRILSEFVTAMKNDEFTFYLQPQCRISTGKVVGCESLARWIKKDGTIVPPMEYIPILEKYGFIVDLDKVLWEKVFAMMSEWIKAGHRAVPVSLNVSRTDIFTLDIPNHFHELAEKYEVPHNLVKIEITESAYIETTSLIADIVKRLRKDGFKVFMDDFGSGYSSLNMLGTLEVDAIKLDAQFLHLKGQDYERGIHIVESVVHMTKLIGLPIIVEGVETKEQATFLADLGCRYAQGFYFYRPMPLAKMQELALDDSKLDLRGFTVKLNEQFRIREFLDKNVYSDTMLNNVIGAVAIYAWHDDHVDIVRYNQQFYESVNVPDFQERLENIERFMPPEDLPKIFAALKRAMENKLGGSEEILHFYKTDGTLSSYKMRFYHLGKKEDGERFYGSASNETALADLGDEMGLIAKYSKDNLIFIKNVEGKWRYHVASHGLSDVFGLTPEQLQEEMNDGRFAKRVVGKKELASFMEESRKNAGEKKDFSHAFNIKAKDGKPKKIELSFFYVGDKTANVDYLLRSAILEEEQK